MNLSTKFIVIVVWQVVEPSDVTLIVHMSMARLQIIETICLHWKGKKEQLVFFITLLPRGHLFLLPFPVKCDTKQVLTQS